MLKFNLGGIGVNTEYQTVNLAELCDIHADIMDLDSFCEDGTVDEFFLSHTLEHIPVTHYRNFLEHMKRKLKTGGIIRVVQTDAGKLIDMWVKGKISFRSMRTPIFTPANRCSTNALQQHQSMWSEEELKRDFELLGFRTESFKAGSWKYDVDDDLYPEDTEPDKGKDIPNLGVIAIKVD